MAAIDKELQESLAAAAKKSFDLDLNPSEILIEIPKRKDQGDFSTNLAMQLTRTLHKNPREIANALLENIENPMIDSKSIAGPGFINFVLKSDRYAKVVEDILTKQEDYGNGKPNGIRVNLEYVSANPTGSLHLGHARGAAWGDAISRIMKKAGYDVTREYYVNDAGNQIRNLALSLHARYLQALGREAEIGQDGYLGKDIEDKGKELAEKYGEQYADFTEKNLDFFRKEGIAFELAKIQKDLKDFRVEFDVWSSEQALRDAGEVERVLKILEDQNKTYEKDGALWFKTTEYNDDKDRVLRKQDGSYTYLVPDIAYHNNKYDRGFDQLIDFFGADHHGYIPRLKASMAALGHNPDILNVDIIQMVRLVEDGEEVKMSKRLGNAMTINELVDMVGVDAVRYFFVNRALDSHLDFDLKLAKSQSNDNPVYYAQYAHARMCSILKNSPEYPAVDNYEGLDHEKEIELLKVLQDYENVVAETAQTRQVHRIAHYIQNLATKFHSFYTFCRVNDSENPELSAKRLALVNASRIVLANALNLLAVEAVECM
ncbi:arginine--tRNA ligase [Ileibacterium valens]|uniref:Arginine--tRNA ligase n=1 Tax=Ileibacterium valens TaxID=1862668 RepID=A0A1U7NFD9_9FIRM|nr:arginine--tRNA ligase [Ileibacterium valens]OLU37841.1 arginine--tRNA ligase [Erysipelotrichaceae bacterium NYU-BL-E8]OLU38951.1 arginine--tRNA ligase [Ileibacterium valens]OLU40067.1 arginine--tRNA ligase [Erysipelotrichaceae bacterium NYU-BL-F16]